MKKILLALALCFSYLNANSQLVEQYGGGYVSDNAVLNKIDILEIGRSIHVASIEDGKLVVRRFYRGVWEEFDPTPLTGIDKVEKIQLFAYKAVPYVFCFYDGKFSVLRAIADKWEFVGKETFSDGAMLEPDFSVIGEVPYIIYKDKDYNMLRMVSLMDGKWYDVDLMSSKGLKSCRLAANLRGDLYISILDAEGAIFKKVDQLVDDVANWPELTKKVKIEGAARIDDFEFIENKAYFTYSTNIGPVIMTLEDMSKKWEVVEKAEVTIVFGKDSYNLNISEYYFFTSLSANGIPQFLKNNKQGAWGKVTDLSTKKATAIASCQYKNVIYVAYVDAPTSKLMVKKIEKGEIAGTTTPTGNSK